MSYLVALIIISQASVTYLSPSLFNLCIRNQGRSWQSHRLCTAQLYGIPSISGSLWMTDLEVIQCTTSAAICNRLPLYYIPIIILFTSTHFKNVSKSYLAPSNYICKIMCQ